VSEPRSNPRRRRRIITSIVVGVVLVVVAIIGAGYYASSHGQDWARQKLIGRLEQMTGGRVEISRLQWNLSRLQFDIHNLTIHGLEAPDQVPYFHADRLLIDVRIVSIWRRQIALNNVEVDRPIVHLIVYGDGHTNQPKPKVEAQSSAQSIFDLAIKHAQLRNGELLFNDTVLPFDVSAAEIEAGMRNAGTDHYQGTLKLAIEHARYAEHEVPNGSIDVAFTLRPNQLSIDGLHVVSGESKADASGLVRDFANPAVKVDYRATLDAGEFARMLRQREFRRGKVDVSGTATYERSVFATGGKLAVQAADYYTPGLHVRNVDAAANFAVSEKDIVLTHIVARVMGGIARGDATVRWASTRQGGKTVPETGDVRLNVQNASAAMVAKAFSTPQVRLEELKAAGSGGGSVNLHWRGSPARAVVDLRVSMSPPATLNDGETPVTGELIGAFDVAAQQLRADSIQVALPFLSLSGNGTLGSDRKPLHVDLEVGDLRRLQPVLAMVNQENSSAGELSGKLKFSGELQGKVLTPEVNGHVQVNDFTFPLAAIWTPPNVPRPSSTKYIRLDSGSADIAFSSAGLSVRNGTIRRAGAQAQIDLAVTLQNGNFTDSSPVATHVVIRNAALTDLQQIAGYNLPITGTVAASVNVHGTRLDLQGNGNVRVTDASAYGQSIRSATADLIFANQEAQVKNLLIAHDQAQVTGSGAYNLKQGQFTLQLAGSNFELATIPELNRSRVSVSGRLSFTASGSGTLESPVVNANARLQNLVVNGERVGDAELLAVTKGDTVHLTGRSNFESAEVDLDGRVRLREQMPATVALQFSNFDFMPFLQSIFHTNLNGQSYVGGNVVIEGPLKNPAALALTAEIPKLTAQMEGVELHNQEPIRITMANQLVKIDSLRLEGTDTQFRANGSVSLIGDRKVDLHANGRLNLKLVQSFNSDINSGGAVDVNLSVSGTVSRPNLVGEVQIANGSVSLIDFPNGLSGINGTLVFNEQRVQVQSLTARTGGGDIRIGGFATYNPGLAFNVTVRGDGIRMRYPQGVSTTGNLDLKLAGNLSSSMLSGDVTITRFSLNDQFDLASYLAKSIRPPETPRASPLNNVRFNIHVVSTPQLQVESSLAKVAGNADLRIRGTPNNPVLLGRINITEGTLDFNGANYRIDRGDVSFVNPTHTEPTIDVAATTRVRDYDITLRFSGEPARGLKTNYSSDPPLPAPDIINLLAFGQTREEAQIEATQGTQTMTETVSNAILGQAINNAVSNRVQKLFGVSRVKISPEVGSAQTNPTAQITIEQQVSDKVTVTYISNLTQSSQQSIFVEYYLDRNVSLIAGRDQYGVVSFNMRIRQRKR
jgi:translocation and assembly module TamB